MKKRLYPVIFGMAMSALLLSACTTNPDWVVERFVKHWFKGNLEDAKPYLMPEFRKYADSLKNRKSQEEFEKMSETEVKFKIMNVTKENDSIRLYHCEVTLNGIEQEMNITLKRLKNRWFVDIAN